MELLHNFFAENVFIPHGHCYLWMPELVALHLSSDALITLAYYSIPITLVYFVQKRQDLPFDWIFLLFGSFIILCGTTHAMEVWTLWHPIYWVSGVVKALTAIVSLITAGILFLLMPQVIAIPSPKQLEEANHKLETEIVQRQQIEADLQHSKQMLQLVIDTIPQAIFWKDRNSVYLGCNRPFARAAGFENPQDIVGKTDYDLPWKPEDTESYLQWDRKVIESDSPQYHILESLQKPDGTKLWLDTHKIPLHDLDSKVVGVLCTFEDITERQRSQEALKRAKEELEKSYNLLYAVIEGTPDPIFVKDLEGRHLLFNSAGAKSFGATVEETLGQDIFAIQPRELAMAIWETDRRIVTTGQTEAVEESIFDGKQVRIYLSTKSAYRNSTGQIIGSIGIARDISDRKKAQETLDREREFLKAILNNLAEGIVACDDRGVLTLFNHATRGFHGLPEQRIPAEKWAEYFNLYRSDGQTLMSKEDIPLYRALQGEKITNQEMVIAPKNGNGRTLLASGQAIVDSSGKKLGAVVAMHDITDRKAAELALQKAKDELEIRVEERTAELQNAIAQLQTEIADRERAQAALQESETLLKAIVDNSPAAIYLKDLEGRYLLMNRVCATLFQKTPEEAIGKTDSDNLVRETAEAFRANDRRVIAAGRSLELEEALLQEDGLHTYISIKFPLYDSTNRMYAVGGISTDISDRKEAEERLRRSETRFRKQAQREKLLNRLASEIRASLDLDTILENAVSEIRQLFAIDRCTFSWYRLEDGERYWEIVKDDRHPDLQSLVGIRTPMAQTGSLTETLFACQILQLDRITTLEDPVGQHLLDSYGITALLVLPVPTNFGEIGAISCIRHSKPQNWMRSEVALLQAVTVQLALAIDQAELYKQSRTTAILAQTKARELEQTLQELQQTQAQLVHSEKMSSLGQLVGGVAHEINNPVSFIYGNITPAKEYVEDLLKIFSLYQQFYPEPVPEIQKELEELEIEFLIEDLFKLLDSMKTGADRIRAIVHSLRNFSRLDESEMKMADIHDGIESALLILQNRLNATDTRPAIAVIKNYGKLPQIECYPGQLNQLFMNVLMNAIDALESVFPSSSSLVPSSNSPTNEGKMTDDPGQKTIRISTKIEEDRLFICIADNGKGMSETVKNRVFDPFFTTKPVGSGTGLGMSIGYQIVKKHDGELTCFSEPGSGTEFTIQIPLSQPKGATDLNRAGES